MTSETSGRLEDCLSARQIDSLFGWLEAGAELELPVGHRRPISETGRRTSNAKPSGADLPTGGVQQLAPLARRGFVC